MKSIMKISNRKSKSANFIGLLTKKNKRIQSVITNRLSDRTGLFSPAELRRMRHEEIRLIYSTK